MFESAHSPSDNLSFDDVIKRLSTSYEVEGIARFGSRKTGIPSLTSDYDLLVLINHSDVHIFPNAHMD